MPDWKQRAKILIDLGRYGEAIAALLEALAEQPDDAFVYSQLAYCHTSRGDKELALAAAYKAVLLAPNQGHTHYSLALCQLRANQPVLAQVAIVSALHRNPTDTGTLVLAARIAVACANREAACHLLDSALELDPTQKEARNLKVEILLQEQRKEEAKTINEETLRLHPEDPYAVEVHAWMLKEAGQLREAEERYDEVLRLNPHSQSSKQVKIILLKEKSKLSKFFLSFGDRYSGDRSGFFLLFSCASVSLFVLYLFGDKDRYLDFPKVAAKSLLLVLICSRFSGPLSDAFLGHSRWGLLERREILHGRWIACLVFLSVPAHYATVCLPTDAQFLGAIAFVTPLAWTIPLTEYFFCDSPSRERELYRLAFAFCLLALLGVLLTFWPMGIAARDTGASRWFPTLPNDPIHGAGVMIFAVLALLALAVGYRVKGRS